jgi:hypothetical protein
MERTFPVTDAAQFPVPEKPVGMTVKSAALNPEMPPVEVAMGKEAGASVKLVTPVVLTRMVWAVPSNWIWPAMVRSVKPVPGAPVQSVRRVPKPPPVKTWTSEPSAPFPARVAPSEMRVMEFPMVPSMASVPAMTSVKPV